MTIPPDFMKQFERDEFEVEVTQAQVLDIGAMAGMSSEQFIESMCDILDTIGKMTVKELSTVVLDEPHAHEKIRDLIILAYRCGMSTEALRHLTNDITVTTLLTPTNELMQSVHDLVRKLASDKRNRRRK